MLYWGNQRWLVGFLVFQMGWLACVLGGNTSALVFVAIFLLMYRYLFSPESMDWIYALRIAVLGWVLDSLMLYSNVFVLDSGSKVIPVWLMCLWVVFALLVKPCFSFLRGRYILSSIVGFLGGAVSYYAGIKLNPTIEFAEPLDVSLLIVALSWAAFFPFAMFTVAGSKLNSVSAAEGRD